MPKRTIYVREEHQELWGRVKELVGDESLSEIVAEGLKRVIRAREVNQEGFERVELVVGIGQEPWRKIAFEGREVAEWPPNEYSPTYTAYLTPKGNILIFTDLFSNGATHEIYESIAEASEKSKEYEYKHDKPLYPAEFLSEIAEEIGEEFIDELDI